MRCWPRLIPSGTWPPAGSLSYHFANRRGTALSLHGVGGSIGDVAGPLATGALLLFLTWREIINVYAAIPLLLGLLGIWAFRNIGQTTEPASTDAASNVAGRVRATGALLKSRALWGLTAVRSFRAMALAALVTILPLYLSNDLGMNEWGRGFHIGLLIAVGLVAKTGAGYLSDRWGRKPVLVPGLVWSCVIALGLTAFDAGIMLTVTIALLGLFLYPDQPILTAAIYDTLGREVATSGLGVIAFVSFLMSAASAVIAGALYESVGFDAAVGYIAALFASGGGGVCGGAGGAGGERGEAPDSGTGGVMVGGWGCGQMGVASIRQVIIVDTLHLADFTEIS